MATELDMLNIEVNYGQRTKVFTFPKSATIGSLKESIGKEFDITLAQQSIFGWCKDPISDDDSLEISCFPNKTTLVVSTKASKPDIIPTVSDSEIQNLACMSFIEHFSSNFLDTGLVYHMCCLSDALDAACFPPSGSRKVLLLYFHNKNDPFDKIFGKNLSKPKVKDLINEHFYLIGWDVQCTENHNALIRALNEYNELSVLSALIEKQTCAAIFIVPVMDSISLFSCIAGKVSDKDFLNTLKQVEAFLVEEDESEQLLSDTPQAQGDIGSTKYQQIMMDLLGDRDYDSFDYYEMDLLKEKIGYALFGPPETEEGYTTVQMKKIDALFKVILEENNGIAKWKDRVAISFIYNCTEVLPSEKRKRAKKYKDYNPNTDVAPTPIFILRKCKNSSNPCRVIIDDTGRVYKNWRDYSTRNKLPKCEMTTPKGGRYLSDDHGGVKLEKQLSPVCGITSKILQGVDLAHTAAGLVSGGIILAAAIPALAVAPVALIVAGATGIGLGLYSVGRNAYTLYDRNKHKESMSFVNSEARGAYLNIVAGSLGFVGAGANVAVSQLAAQGLNVGQGATSTLEVIRIANMGASSINAANSGLDVLDSWFSENQKVSLLTMMQLSASVFFFGHAVYQIQERSRQAQANTLRDHHEALRDNKERKRFNRLWKSMFRDTYTNVEVVKTVTHIHEMDELIRSLLALDDDGDVEFNPHGDGVKLNGVPIDLGIFMKLSNTFLISFVSVNDEQSMRDMGYMSERLETLFTGLSPPEIEYLAIGVIKFVGGTPQLVRNKLISALAELAAKLSTRQAVLFRKFDRIFPDHRKYFSLLWMVVIYFQILVDGMEVEYQKNVEDLRFEGLSSDERERAVEIFHSVSEEYYVGSALNEFGLDSLIEFFYTWFAFHWAKDRKHQQRRMRRIEHSDISTVKDNCAVCGGVYYKHQSHN